MRVIMPLWYKIDADGLEYLPENGGCLFISNHRSMADPILIGVQNPQAQFCFLAKQELFSEGFVGWLLKKLGAVAIDRGTGDTDPLEEIIYRLQNGENALIFPEGTRSKDGKLGRFKTGAALIAAQTDVPVVPVGISFDDEELHFRSIIHIRYGEPFRLPQTDPKNPSPAVLKEIRQEMTKNVSALLKMDDSPGRKAIAQKETVYSDGDESTEVPEQKVQPAVENLESEGTEKSMEKNNQNEKNNKEQLEEEKEILKQIEEDLAEDAEEKAENAKKTVKETAEDAKESADTVKEKTKKAVREVSESFEEQEEKDIKAAKEAAAALRSSGSYKKRLKDADSELEKKLDEDDLFDEEPPKKSKKKAAEQADDSEEKFFEEEDFDEDFDFDEKPGLFSGLSLKNPFKKKKKDDFDDFEDEFEDDIDEDNIDNAYEDDAYDDEYEDEAGEKRIDYGKIALVLTFVILGIFAVDFGYRLYRDYKNTKGQLDLQNQASKVESMADSSVETEPALSSAAPAETLATEVTSTMYEIVTVTTSTTEAFVDNRDTQTVEVANDTMHSGSLILVDAAHQQVVAPALITFASFGPQHLRLVSTEMTVDASLATPITNWFNDFFAATGLGNVMVYSTTGTPGYPPYSVAIPERSSGLSLDLSILNEAAQSHSPYTPDGNYAWLTEHAADYGFIVRYPEGKAEKTGLEAQTWHFRFVGAPHAKYMYENNLCLEEYLEEIKKHTVSTDHLQTTVNGINYEMYYVPAAETGTTTQIKYPMSADGSTPMISGDNAGGFVVAVVKQ